MSLVNWLVLNPQLVAHLLVIQYGNQSSIAHLLITKHSAVVNLKSTTGRSFSLRTSELLTPMCSSKTEAYMISKPVSCAKVYAQED